MVGCDLPGLSVRITNCTHAAGLGLDHHRSPPMGWPTIPQSPMILINPYNRGFV
jgi:hypothetical protein